MRDAHWGGMMAKEGSGFFGELHGPDVLIDRPLSLWSCATSESCEACALHTRSDNGSEYTAKIVPYRL